MQVKEINHLDRAWETEFQERSKKRIKWFIITCVSLLPLLLIDINMVPKNHIVFFIWIKLLPPLIITLIWLFYHIFQKITSQQLMITSSLVVILSIAYRPAEDLNNFILINIGCIVLLATLPVIKITSAFLIAIFYFFYNVSTFFLFYSHIPINNSGIAIIAGFAAFHFFVLRFRYENLRRNFKQSHHLSVQNIQIREQKQELETLHKNLEEKNKILNQTLEALEENNKALLDSLDYALLIQNAILPIFNEFQSSFQDSFIFYQPRDIVSGDFYWFQEVEEEWIIVVGDCTGHGVPGALMSMLSISLLERIVVERKIQTPHLILKALDNLIYKTLKQGKGENTDGLDIAICSISKKKKQLLFAGANNSLWFVKDNHLEVIKGTRRGIGGNARNNKAFQSHQLVFTEDTHFYMMSDGFRDQFGGFENKKFSSRKLKELILEIHLHPTEKQKEILEKTLNDWIKESKEKQIDDVTIMGFKV